MKLSFLIIICISLLVMVGCAATKATIADIKADPEGFKNEAQDITTGIGTAFPLLPTAAGVGIGYGIAFLRRLYVNLRKKKAELSK